MYILEIILFTKNENILTIIESNDKFANVKDESLTLNLIKQQTISSERPKTSNQDNNPSGACNTTKSLSNINSYAEIGGKDKLISDENYEKDKLISDENYEKDKLISNENNRPTYSTYIHKNFKNGNKLNFNIHFNN